MESCADEPVFKGGSLQKNRKKIKQVEVKKDPMER